jgi:hypothetical protein
MSVVKTIYGNLPEDLNRLSISSLGYVSVYAQQVHDEVNKISGRLQAALDAEEISGIDANDFDDLTVRRKHAHRSHWSNAQHTFTLASLYLQC